MFRKKNYIPIVYAVLSILVIIYVTLTYSTKELIRKDPVDEKLVYKLGFLNLHDSVKYVGIDACKECHLDMWQVYMRSGMGQSWGFASKEKSASVFNPHQALHDSKSAFYYQPYWKNGMMLVKEFRIENKDTNYQRTEIVDFIVGSGQHTNSHIQSINGYLFQVPFTYYTQINLLDFPPGFEGGNNARFSRPIGHECITCHNSYPDPVQGSLNKYKTIPLGINCERCHGPGELHVNAMKAGQVVNTDIQADFTIVNPKRLPNELQFELCSRCHTQGNAVLKNGKDFYDFKPGMYLTEVMDVFREKYENDEDAFWMETHPERLKKSKCFIATQNHPDFKPLTCTNCHFTSSMRHISYKETPIDTFRNQCLSCHNPPYQAACKENKVIRNKQNDNCITCHMVKTGVFDIPHVRISDHFIRITDKWKEPIKSTNEIETGAFLGLKCMNNEHPDYLTTGRAYLYHFEKFNPDPALLDSASFYLSKYQEKEVVEWWIYYYFLRSDYRKIVALEDKYLSNKMTENPVLNYQIGQAYHYLNLNIKAIKYFSLAVEQQAYNLDYRNKLGSELIIQKKYAEAQREFDFIISENPKIPSAFNNLGFLELISNNYSTAEKHFNAALRIDPDYFNAHLNLLKLYMGRSENLRAKRYAKFLESKFPGNAQLVEINRMLK
ncbi:MAG: hypothetical protein ISR55_12185 [Bacteroidetes bacterium]|nr:hypothetical protein [Bacteroidota bacterium]MBL6964575.1 hypothetical protein [Bacteroidota bacterium]